MTRTIQPRRGGGPRPRRTSSRLSPRSSRRAGPPRSRAGPRSRCRRRTGPSRPTRSNQSVRASRTAGPTHSRRVPETVELQTRRTGADAQVRRAAGAPCPVRDRRGHRCSPPARGAGGPSSPGDGGSRWRRARQTTRRSGAPGLPARSRGSGPRATPRRVGHRIKGTLARGGASARARQNEGSPEHGGPWVDAGGRVQRARGVLDRPARFRALQGRADSRDLAARARSAGTPTGAAAPTTPGGRGPGGRPPRMSAAAARSDVLSNNHDSKSLFGLAQATDIVVTSL